MAITNIWSPSFYAPSGNDMIWVFSSTYVGVVGYEDIKFTLQILIGGDTINLETLPNAGGYGVFNIKRIVESYISNDVLFDSTTIAARTNDNIIYTIIAGTSAVGVGDEYQIAYERLAWSSAFDKIDFLGYEVEDYVIYQNNVESAQFLTNKSSFKVGLTDSGIISYNTEGFKGATVSTFVETDWQTNGVYSGNMGNLLGNIYKTSGAIGSVYIDVPLVAAGSICSILFSLAFYEKTDTALPVKISIIKTGTGAYERDIKFIYANGTYLCNFNINDIVVGFNRVRIYSDSLTDTFTVSQFVLRRADAKVVSGVTYKAYNANNQLLDTLTLTDALVQNDLYPLPNEINHKYKFLVAPSCPYNINTIEAGFINANTHHYTIEIDADVAGAIKTFYLQEDNCKYTKKRLHFLNRLGGYDSQNFLLKNRRKIMAKKNTFTKKIDSYTGTASSRGVTQHYTSYQEVYTLATDWLTDNEFSDLIDLFISPSIYYERDAVTFIPVNCDVTEYTQNTRVNDGLSTYELQITFSYENTTQLL